MRILLFLIFLLSEMTIFAQDKKDSGVINSHAIHSDILQEDRFIEVYTPYQAKLSQQYKYEVIYILDGAAHFNTVVSILKQLAIETGDPSFMKKIVVGIGNIWTRDRDYTPTHINSSPFVDSMAAIVSGGGEKFISFLEKELIPFMTSKYPIEQGGVLIGHSLGGLMVINILFKHASLFSKYAAIDPSLWWDDQKLLIESKKVLHSEEFEKRSLFLAIANTREKDIDTPSQIRADTTNKTFFIRPSLIFTDYVNENKKNKLKFNWKYYKDSDHMSVFPSATYDALKFLLQPLSGR